MGKERKAVSQYIYIFRRNAEKGQLVLFDPNNQSVSVRNYLPDISSEDSTEKEPDCCPYCHTVLPKAKVECV
jgi:hypothetical protein